MIQVAPAFLSGLHSLLRVLTFASSCSLRSHPPHPSHPSLYRIEVETGLGVYPYRLCLARGCILYLEGVEPGGLGGVVFQTPAGDRSGYFGQCCQAGNAEQDESGAVDRRRRVLSVVEVTIGLG